MHFARTQAIKTLLCLLCFTSLIMVAKEQHTIMLSTTFAVADGMRGAWVGYAEQGGNCKDKECLEDKVIAELKIRYRQTAKDQE
jgi:hypothetical protein